MNKREIRWVFLLVCMDQLTKFIANLTVELGDEIAVLGRFLCITDAQNFGTALHIVEGHYLLVIFITILSLVLVFSYFHHIQSDDKMSRWGLVFMMSGLCGNLLDRLFLHYVRDIFLIAFLDASMILNLADLFLWIGLILVIISHLKTLRGPENAK